MCNEMWLKRKPATHPTRQARQNTHVVDLHVISHWPKKAAASIEFHAINLKFFGEHYSEVKLSSSHKKHFHPHDLVSKFILIKSLVVWEGSFWSFSRHEVPLRLKSTRVFHVVFLITIINPRNLQRSDPLNVNVPLNLSIKKSSVATYG